jgi:tetratricopeptide (TPR) repeat protein
MKIRLKFTLIALIIFGFACLSNAQKTDSLYAQKIDSLYKSYTLEKDQKIKDDLANKIFSIMNKDAYNEVIYPKPEKYIELAAQYKNDTLLAYYCYFFSWDATKTGDYNKAFELLSKSLKYFENLKDTLYVSSALKQIGFCYLSIKNYPEAINYYRKAIDLINTLNTEIKNRWKLSFNYYQGLAKVYLEDHNVDSAFIKLQNAYNISVKHEKELSAIDKIDFGLRLNYLYANLYLQKKDTLLAETYFKKCFAVNTDSLDPSTGHYMNACLLYSNFKKDLHDYKNALHYAYLAYNFAMNRKFTKFIADASEQLYSLYDKTQQTDSAYHYLKQTLIYKDSISSAILLSQIQNTTLLMHLDEKEKEVKLAEDSMKQRQNVQYVAIAIGIIVLLSLFFLFSRSILIGTRTIEFIGTVILLMVFEFIDLYIHPYLGKWSNESPLIMLLALIIIASILIPIHHKIEHLTKEKLIEKNKKIRLAHAKKTIKELEETEESELAE